MRQILILFLLFFFCGCASLQWWENPGQYTVQGHLSAVGTAKGDLAKSHLDAESNARNSLAEIMKERVKQFEAAWKEKSKLYTPFEEKDFLDAFISTQRIGASVQAKSEDTATNTVRCMAVRSLEQFYNQLRVDGMSYISKKKSLGKQEEIEWDSTCKGLIDDFIAKHNQKANLKPVSGGVEAQ